MELLRRLLGRLVALALDRVDVDQDGPLHLLGTLEDFLHQRDVVAVERADVVEAHLLEEAARHEDGAHAILEVARRLVDLVADMRDAHEQAAHVALGARVLRRDADAREVLAHGADIGVYRHLVVVEDDDELRAEVAGVVERLERLAARQRAVADDGDDLVLLPLGIACERHAERRRDGRARMADAEGIVGRLKAVGEAGDAALLAQRRERIPASREDLMAVGLMADVPDELVCGEVKDAVERERQLDRAEVRREVPAVL